jgi:Uncharacterised nucleotidyltransferase
MCAVSVAGSDVVWQRARHEHARLALEQVLAGCRDSGVDVLPVKGVLTARLLYADPGQRPIQDVDLRVRPEDLKRVRMLGERSGWRLVSRSRAYGTLGFDVLGFLVEFESHVGPPGMCALRIDDMLRRATPQSGPLGLPHLEPELHDHALLLCVNAFKDKLVDALPWAVRDLELLPAHRNFSPERLATLAGDVGAATILWIVAAWVARMRDARAWDHVRSELGRSTPRALYAAVFERALRANPPSRRWLRVLARAGSDRRAQRIRALGTLAFRAVEDAVALAWPPNAGGHGRIQSEGPRLPPAVPMCRDR